MRPHRSRKLEHLVGAFGPARRMALFGVALASSAFGCSGSDASSLFLNNGTGAGASTAGSPGAAGTGAGTGTGGLPAGSSGSAGTAPGASGNTGVSGAVGSGGSPQGSSGGNGTSGSTASGGGGATGSGGAVNGGTAGTTGGAGSSGTAGQSGNAGAGGGPACVPTGPEICDGIDNNCNGNIDEMGACANGCVGATFGGHGYMFCTPRNNVGQQPTQATAAAFCQQGQRMMDLVSIQSAEENAWLVTTSNQNLGQRVWTGGERDPNVQQQARWVWPDMTAFWQGGANGNPVNGAYANWSQGSPGGNVGGAAACMTLQLTPVMGVLAGEWNDVQCATVGVSFICESR